MNHAVRDLLEQHFDVAFTAPDGIAKLRELILTLAMQGRLVEQNPADQPASELLKEIEAEKKRLVRAGEIKAPKPLPPITSEELPYQLPRGWARVRLGEIGTWKSGSTPSRNNYNYYGGNIPWVKSGEVKQGQITQTEETITELALNECSLSLNPKGSVLVAMYGANIGEVGILEIEAATNQAICACKTYRALDERYLLNLISSLKPYFISQGAGAAQPNISREKIVATPISLPPLAEQHRIVARIDQLMAYCDALDRLRKEMDDKRLAVHAAAIQQLLSIQSSKAWDFLEQHFNDLYSVKENVAELRKAILQLAVMGRLVPQDPNDPPASELLEDIDAEKQRLVKAGKIKTPKPLPPIKPEEVPYQLPQGWEWARLSALGYFLGGKTPSTNNESLWGGCIPWISPKDMKVSRIQTAEDSVSELGLLSGLALIPRNSILMVVRSGILRRCFPVAINEVECTINQDLKALVPFHPKQADFLFLMFRGLESYILSRFTKKGVTVESMVFEAFSGAAFPLPPLHEQHRIVAKIDELMALCDSLDQQIDAATAKQTELLDAVMAQV